MAAGGPSYFSLMKSNQKSSQQKCFFARKASALQIGQNLGRNYFAHTRISPTHAKTSYALQPHSPPSFCPLSPEAVLLTGKGKAILNSQAINLKILQLLNPLSTAGEERVVQRSVDRVSRCRHARSIAGFNPLSTEGEERVVQRSADRVSRCRHAMP